jgi:hypothetical protein
MKEKCCQPISAYKELTFVNYKLKIATMRCKKQSMDSENKCYLQFAATREMNEHDP